MYAQVCYISQHKTSTGHSPQPGSAPEDAQDLMGCAVVVAPALQYLKSDSLSCRGCRPCKHFCMNMSQSWRGHLAGTRPAQTLKGSQTC